MNQELHYDLKYILLLICIGSEHASVLQQPLYTQYQKREQYPSLTTKRTAISV